MRLILVDPKAEMAAAWKQSFHDDADIRSGYFEQVTDAEAFATAGNSFGLMDGGVDLAVARFDPSIEERVQWRIWNEWRGELPVGDCLGVPMVKGGYRLLLYAPTMRVPMPIVGTDNVYRAMWAALLRAEWDGIDSLAMPAFGALTGRVPYSEVARQMALAWRNFQSVPEQMTWPLASARHDEITGRTPDDLYTDSCLRQLR